MKKTLIVSAGLMIAGILPNGTLVLANMHKMNVEESTQKMKKDLKLTSAQESEVRQILEDKKSKMEEAMSSAHEKIRDLLTDEQKDKFNKMVEKKEKED